jgi:hypothetical protein
MEIVGPQAIQDIHGMAAVGGNPGEFDSFEHDGLHCFVRSDVFFSSFFYYKQFIQWIF